METWMWMTILRSLGIPKTKKRCDPRIIYDAASGVDAEAPAFTCIGISNSSYSTPLSENLLNISFYSLIMSQTKGK